MKKLKRTEQQKSPLDSQKQQQKRQKQAEEAVQVSFREREHPDRRAIIEVRKDEGQHEEKALVKKEQKEQEFDL